MSEFQSIKYRLIGATVIIVSFAFAWWLLLDHEVHRLQDDQIDIPASIKIEPFEVEKPDIPDIDAISESKKIAPEVMIENPSEKEVQPDLVQSEESTEKSVEAQPPKMAASARQPAVVLDSQGLPEAWVLQVASFQDKSNAIQLQKKLVDKDLPAYVKTFNLPEGKSYRVLIGPKLSKERVAKLSKVIEKEHGLKSMIMRYKPGLEE